MRAFLKRFHDEDLAAMRPPREAQKSFILPASLPQQGLDRVLAGLVGSISRLMKKNGQEQTIATVDQDATIIESHKKSALAHYEGGRGYQPMVALWSEANLVLASEFRDGNVPARQSPLSCAQMAFQALPASIKERYFRGDSACHENTLLNWLADPARALEPGGRIGFCVSAVMELALLKSICSLKESA